MTVRKPKFTKEQLAEIALLMKEDDNKEGDNNLVKIVIGIVVSLVTASLIFLATNTYTTNSQITAISTNMAYVVSNVDGLTKKMDAIQTNYATKLELNGVDTAAKQREEDLNSRLRQVEMGNTRHK